MERAMDELFLCRHEGFRAYIKSKGSRKDANPYSANSPKSLQFDRGWREAKTLYAVKAKSQEKRSPVTTPSIN
jgi:ribosome modulation factor